MVINAGDHPWQALVIGKADAEPWMVRDRAHAVFPDQLPVVSGLRIKRVADEDWQDTVLRCDFDCQQEREKSEDKEPPTHAADVSLQTILAKQNAADDDRQKCSRADRENGKQAGRHAEHIGPLFDR